MSIRLTTILSIMLCIYSVHVFGQEQDEMQSVSLDSLVVVSKSKDSYVETLSSGGVVWNMNSMELLPKILGNADPMHYAQMLPGVQTNGEYESGIHIQGCDNSHNMISVNDVPIYNVNHLLGFFSTFNSSHFENMSLTKSANSASYSNMLGGELCMTTGTNHVDTISGELSLGFISSQGTIRLPLNKKTSLLVSLRKSYLNLLYSRWLQTEGDQIKYSFYDANVTLTHKLNSYSTLSVDMYGGNDDVNMREDSYLADIKDKWGNYMLSARYLFDNGKVRSGHTIYTTSNFNRLGLVMNEADFKLSSSIFDVGYKGNVKYGNITVGLDIAYHRVKPQYLTLSGTFNIKSNEKVIDKAVETSAYADYAYSFMNYSTIRLGVRPSLYGVSSKVYKSLDPIVSYRYENSGWLIDCNYSLKHQYLFQTGFASVGLPTDFWLSSNQDYKPQYAHGIFASISKNIFGKKFKVTADVYYKRLYNQVEYSGNILDFVNTAYDLNNSLISGSGRTYGGSIMLNKCTGKLLGWISYSYGRSWRYYEEYDGKCPSNHERPHELDFVATYVLNNRMNFSGTFVYASGTPFTAVKEFYLLNGNIMSEFGQHNQNRLPAYCRLDISANFQWKTKTNNDYGFNVSLYNALSHKNVLFYRMKINTQKYFYYKPVTFAMKVLPSISFYYKF